MPSKGYYMDVLYVQGIENLKNFVTVPAFQGLQVNLCVNMYIYALVTMCKASDKYLLRDMENKNNRNWRQERSSKAWIHSASNTCACKVCIHIANVPTSALF